MLNYCIFTLGKKLRWKLLFSYTVASFERCAVVILLAFLQMNSTASTQSCCWPPRSRCCAGWFRKRKLRLSSSWQRRSTVLSPALLRQPSRSSRWGDALEPGRDAGVSYCGPVLNVIIAGDGWKWFVLGFGEGREGWPSGFSAFSAAERNM